MTKFRVKEMSTEANTYKAPKRSYVFRKGEWQDIKEKDDIVYFKSKTQFEEKKIIIKQKPNSPTKTKDKN